MLADKHMHRLPPLNALKAFEAAARHMSFARAADELNVTQSAVSQHVRQLEEHLGLKLFLRQNNSLTLTEAGRALLPPMREAFKSLLEAAISVKSRDFENILKISAPPTFSIKWLRSRLGDFRTKYPDVEIKLIASKKWIDFSREDFDAAIRYGQGEYPGLITEKIMSEDIFPVCSPTLFHSSVSLRSLADLRFHTLLHAEHSSEDITAPNWVHWVSTMSIEGIDASKGPSYTPASLAIDAAIAGEGIALAKGKWVDDDIAAGRLVKPFEEVLPSPFSYYLVYPGGAASRKLAIFRRWLLELSGAKAITAVQCNTDSASKAT